MTTRQKWILPLAILLSLSSLQIQAAESKNKSRIKRCELPTANESKANDISRYTLESPQGSCDYLGHLDPSAAIFSCLSLVKEKGYDCYQITKYREESWKLFHESDNTYRACWGCIE